MVGIETIGKIELNEYTFVCGILFLLYLSLFLMVCLPTDLKRFIKKINIPKSVVNFYSIMVRKIKEVL